GACAFAPTDVRGAAPTNARSTPDVETTSPPMPSAPVPPTIARRPPPTDRGTTRAPQRTGRNPAQQSARSGAPPCIRGGTRRHPPPRPTAKQVQRRAFPPCRMHDRQPREQPRRRNDSPERPPPIHRTANPAPAAKAGAETARAEKRR